MGIFSKIGSANTTCPVPSPLTENASEPFVSDISFHTFNMILSGACTALVILIILSLQIAHAAHYSQPNEQRKIMNISLIMPIYSVLAFLSICYPNAYAYLFGWMDLFQSFALGSFLLLLDEFVASTEEERKVAFMQVQSQSQLQGNKVESEPFDGLQWHRGLSKRVLQYPIVALVTGLATCIAQAAHIYCFASSKPRFAHLWINIIINISLLLAVMAVLNFFKMMKRELRPHRVMLKLVALKLVIFLTFVERIIFWALRSASLLTQSSSLTYADINIGMPMMVICLQTVPLSLLFAYAYRTQPYKAKTRERMFLSPRIWLGMVDPRDLFSAMRAAFAGVGRKV